MAPRPPQKQSLLKKALREKKVLNQEVLMYQRVMEVMRNENTFEDILKLITLSVTKGLGFDRAGIFLVNRERNVIERVLGIDRYGKFEGKGVEYPLSTQNHQHLFSDMINGYSKGRFTNNLRQVVKKESFQNEIDPGVFCNAVVPITIGNNRTIGILAVDNLFTQRRLHKTDMLSLINFATQAGLAIESFQLHEKIRDLTIKDGLTGVFNRRYFDNYLPREVLRCRRYKRQLSLLYVDLDRFKEINDSYGHPAGDAVLKHVAGLLVKGLRNVDVVARMGGDEFAVIMPEVGADIAMAVAERLFISINQTPAPVEAMRQNSKPITVSMGLSCFSESVKDYKELVKLADQSLYRAKTAGRNRMGDLIVHQP